VTALFEISRIEGLLTQAFGTQVKIAKSERLAPWFVARCTIACEAADAPTSVIVKVLRHGTWRANPLQVCTGVMNLSLKQRGGVDPVFVPYRQV
jgi:hypothetical protein